ncbi:MAG: glycosyltransferase [Candidatus Paceibacterota bacterium]
MGQPLKICFFGIYDPAYSRNAILLAGLRQAGVDVVECREDWRDPKRYAKLKKSLRALRDDYDFVYAAYPSPVSTILAKMISKKPVVSDAFYSMFDSVVNDRRKYSRFGPKALKLLILDWFGLMFADMIVADTEQHKEYWARWFLVNSEKIFTVYLGINDKVFYPKPATKKDYTLVHFHGTYIPLQGACNIIEAVNLCRDKKDLRFRMIGAGRELPLARSLADRYKLDNIEFIDRNVPLTDLNNYLAEADIVLGVFGDRAKTMRVIPNKVYEGLATERPMITMDTPAVREIFTDEDMLLVKNDPQSIVNGITKLAADKSLRDSLAKHGYDTACKHRPTEVAQSLVDILSKVI